MKVIVYKDSEYDAVHHTVEMATMDEAMDTVMTTILNGYRNMSVRDDSQWFCGTVGVTREIHRGLVYQLRAWSERSKSYEFDSEGSFTEQLQRMCVLAQKTCGACHLYSGNKLFVWMIVNPDKDSMAAVIPETEQICTVEDIMEIYKHRTFKWN